MTNDREPDDYSVWERTFYPSPAARLAPESTAELADLVRQAESEKRPIIPAGEGTRAYLGNPSPPDAWVVSLQKLNAVIRYEPDDYTIGVQAGLPLDILRDTLAENGQDVIGDVPRSSLGLVGGWLATGLPGPRRARHGSVRSELIGLHGMRGGGRIYRSGGMVVKNVAGYDVGRFHVGALGTAGFILEANFKLRPLPMGRAGGWASFSDPSDAWNFAAAFRSRTLHPAVLTLLDEASAGQLGFEWSAADDASTTVVWSFEGNSTLLEHLRSESEKLLDDASQEYDAGRLGDEEVEDLIDRLCMLDVPEPALLQQQVILRASVVPLAVRGLVTMFDSLLRSAAMDSRISADMESGQLIVAWTADAETLTAPLPAIITAAREALASGWLVYLPAEKRAEYKYLFAETEARSRAVSEVARKVLKVFDPRGIFCPGRIYSTNQRWLEPEEAR